MDHKQYEAALKKLGLGIIPLESFVSKTIRILHLCHCGNKWEVAPVRLLCKEQRGCSKCRLSKAHKARLAIGLSKHKRILQKLGLVMLGKYEGRETKTLHRCNRCDFEWSVTPVSLWCSSLYGCPKCARISRHRNKQVPFIEFIRELKTMHGRTIKLLVSKEEYQGNCAQYDFRCSRGHTFNAHGQNVLKGHGCRYCQAENHSKNSRLTDKKFRKLLKRNTKGHIKLIGTYSGLQTEYHRFRCRKGHKFRTLAIVALNPLATGCRVCSKAGYSQIAIQWLKSEEQKRSITIRHAENGGEIRIKGASGSRYRVDGYHSPSRTIFEFYGDNMHGNLAVHEPLAHPSPFSPRCAGALYFQTKARENDLRAAGYHVVAVWESDYHARELHAA